MFWIAVAASVGAGLFGLAGLLDAAQSSPSGEWAGLGVLATLIVDVPVGLIVFGVAFTQRRKSRRAILLLVGLALIVLPFLVAMTLQHRRTRQRRETEERIMRRTREMSEEQRK